MAPTFADKILFFDTGLDVTRTRGQGSEKEDEVGRRVILSSKTDIVRVRV